MSTTAILAPTLVTARPAETLNPVDQLGMVTVLVADRPAASAPVSTTPQDPRARRTTEVVAQLREASELERQALLHQLIEVNVPVAHSIAGRYARRGIDLDDLQQVALLGLTQAARRFDVHAEHDFLAFAVPTIRGELRRHFRDSGWMIRVPRRIQELQARITGDRERLHAQLGRAPHADELAAHLGADVADVLEALAAEGCFRPTSLERPVEDGSGTLADLLGSEDPDLSWVELKVALGSAMAVLSERDQHILRWRFVDERTQQEIADLAGVTQTQVSRILTRVLGVLRSTLSETSSAA